MISFKNLTQNGGHGSQVSSGEVVDTVDCRALARSALGNALGDGLRVGDLVHQHRPGPPFICHSLVQL